MMISVQWTGKEVEGSGRHLDNSLFQNGPLWTDGNNHKFHTHTHTHSAWVDHNSMGSETRTESKTLVTCLTYDLSREMINIIKNNKKYIVSDKSIV